MEELKDISTKACNALDKYEKEFDEFGYYVSRVKDVKNVLEEMKSVSEKVLSGDKSQFSSEKEAVKYIVGDLDGRYMNYLHDIKSNKKVLFYRTEEMKKNILQFVEVLLNLFEEV